MDDQKLDELFQRRARELMLNEEDRAAYLRYLRESERSEFEIKCPGCGQWNQSYESTTLEHVRTCGKLRER